MAILTEDDAIQMYSSTYVKALGIARCYTIPHEDCVDQDLVQDAWIKFSRYIGTDVSHPKALFLQIVRTVALDWYRQKQQRPNLYSLKLEFPIANNKNGYHIVGPKESKRVLKRLIALYPGADAQAVSALLDFGTPERAAVSLLERAGLPFDDNHIAAKRHLIASRRNKFMLRVTTNEHTQLLKLFNYKEWDVFKERFAITRRHNNASDINSLASCLDAHVDLDGSREVACRAFNRSATLLHYAAEVEQSLELLDLPRQFTRFSQYTGDYALKWAQFSKQASYIANQIHDSILGFNALKSLYRAVQRLRNMFENAIEEKTGSHHEFKAYTELSEADVYERIRSFENDFVGVLHGVPSGTFMMSTLDRDDYAALFQNADWDRQMQWRTPPSIHELSPFGLKEINCRQLTRFLDGFELFLNGVTGDINCDDPFLEIERCLWLADDSLSWGSSSDAIESLCQAKQAIEKVIGRQINLKQIDDPEIKNPSQPPPQP